MLIFRIGLLYLEKHNYTAVFNKVLDILGRNKQ